MTFKVIDKKTGKEADEYEIALKEDWAKELMYCDMEGFALLQDGTLILVDECGRFEYCPADRFKIVFEDIDNAPTVEPTESEYGAIQYSNGFNDGFTTAKDTIIHNIAKQYSEHNELVPKWLSIGDLKGGAK